LTRKTIVLFCSLLVVLCLGVWRRSAIQPVALAGSQAAFGELQAVNLVFGEKDNQPTKWDGAASISAGGIEKIVGYHFTRSSRITDNNGWECSTYPWPAFAHEMYPTERPQPRATVMVPIGVTIYYRAPSDAEMRITLANQGEFSFRPADLPQVGAIYPLRATVGIRRSPVEEQLSDEEYEDDYPSVALDGNNLWAAWVGYRNKADQVFLRQVNDGKMGPRLTVTEKPADIFMAGVAAAAGKVTVVWSERDGQNWQLKARQYDGAAWGKTETLTAGSGRNLFHRVASDARGNVHVVWQSWRQGRSDIWLRSSSAGKWLPEINLSDPNRAARADDWEPSVAADRDGTVWVAWDGYATGSYNIYMRPVRNGKPGQLLKVTDSRRFHAHASVAVDVQNRVWVAYDEAPENWGKDGGFLFTSGSGLYDARTVKVAAYAAGRWLTTLRQPGDVAPYAFRRYVQTPRLASAPDGRMWLFLRPRTSAAFPTSRWAAAGKWEVAATYYSGDRWSDLIPFPESVGRDEAGLEAVVDSKGTAWVALLTDHKLWGGPEFGELPGNNDIMLARLRAGEAAAPVLADLPPEMPAGLPSEPKEKEQVAGLRNYAIQAGGKNYRIYRGDLHRHTEISHDGAGDGTLFDAYRYAMDGANMDFLVVTDHQSGDQEYTWWRIEKAADMFHVPGYFTAVYGTERSVPYPNGHRNLLFAQRGVPILPISPEERRGKVNSGPILYPFLKKYNGLATSHSSHTGMGTDWRDNDPDVEPIVEIWEGSRTSVEHEGAPLAPSEKRTELWAGGYKPLGFVWNAWAKGYKLGVQASSDHASTHLSYTCVIAEKQDRTGLMDAMRKRHTYAATTNILLDYRMKMGGETHLQGDIFRSGSLPEITANIQGTAPLKQVVIVRDNQYIYSKEPDGPSFQLDYRETSLTPGTHYYYVRVEQKDRHMAWSSPIWIEYSK
jgi:hypothetical protein